MKQETKGFLQQIFGFALLLTVFFTAAAFILPWDMVNWGRFEVAPSSMVTVTGYAKNQQKSQIARFSAGVDATNEEKQPAVDEVNAAMDEIIQAVVDFGIPREDIKTQSVSVNRIEEPLFDNTSTGEVMWRANNSIEIVLRDVDRASELADLLSSTPATNVYGPNFSLDDTSEAETDLLGLAIDDAREKAMKIAEASGRSLGKVISVAENGASSPITPLMMRAEGVGGGAPVEPGTETVSQSVTVTFELR